MNFSATDQASVASSDELQSLCETGQRQLIGMDYLDAERTLERAEAIAVKLGDLETLSRLYMPLQEARRQRRQRCGEGMIHLSILANAPDDPAINPAIDPAIDPAKLIEKFPHGQLLIAGWGSIEPAIQFRRLQAERSLFVETYLAAVYPVNGVRVVAIVPLAETQMPEPVERPIDALLRLLPPHSIVIPAEQLPPGPQSGTPATYAYTMDLWERLHRPFLAMAESLPDSEGRMDGFRQAIRVDYACELAHQHLAQTAHRLFRARPRVS